MSTKTVEQKRLEALRAKRDAIAHRETILAEIVEKLTVGHLPNNTMHQRWVGAGFNYTPLPKRDQLRFNYARDFNNATAPFRVSYKDRHICVIERWPKPVVFIRMDLSTGSEEYQVTKQLESLMYYRFTDIKMGEMQNEQ